MQMRVTIVSLCLLASLSLVGVAGVAQSTGDAVGVPRLDPEYGIAVAAWWAGHPFNPDSPLYRPQIDSPHPRLNVADYGNDIQRAIDALPAGGGTVVLPAGQYAGGFTISARSNVHLISPGGAVITGPCNRIVVAPVAHDYKSFDRKVLQHDPEAWAALTYPTRNFYVKNLIFDGGGTDVSAVLLQRVRDVVFDGCVFRNYRDPRTGHPGLVCGHMGLHNIWFRNCHFVGNSRWATYLDGAHGSGMINCRVEDAFSGGFLWLTNDDFTEDYNGGGTIDLDEMRCASYTAIYGCTFAGRVNSCVTYQGAHLLVKQCTVEKPVAMLVAFENRCSMVWPEVVYPFLDCVLANNTATVNDALLSIRHLRLNRPDIHRPGQIGQYVVTGNRVTFTSPVKELVKVVTDEGAIAGPNYAGGNMVDGKRDQSDTAPDPLVDTQPPTPPTALRAATRSYSTLHLAWTAAADNAGVASYRVYRDGVLVGRTAVPSYADGNLTHGMAYTYTVQAYDAAGNVSSRSAPLTTTVQVTPRLNLVRNPSFAWNERQYLPHWGGGDGRRWLDTTVAHTGTTAFRAAQAGSAYCGQSLQLLPNTAYVVSVWVKTRAAGPGAGLRLVQTSPTSVILISPKYLNSAHEWTKMETTFRTPAEWNAGRVDLMWDLREGDVVWFDDLTITCRALETPSGK